VAPLRPRLARSACVGVGEGAGETHSQSAAGPRSPQGRAPSASVGHRLPRSAGPPPARQGWTPQALPTHGSVRGADGKTGALPGKTRCARVTAPQRETGRSAAGTASLAPHCCPWPAPAGLVCVSPALNALRPRLWHAGNDRNSHLKCLCDTVASTAENPNTLFTSVLTPFFRWTGRELAVWVRRCQTQKVHSSHWWSVWEE